MVVHHRGELPSVAQATRRCRGHAIQSSGDNADNQGSPWNWQRKVCPEPDLSARPPGRSPAIQCKPHALTCMWIRITHTALLCNFAVLISLVPIALPSLFVLSAIQTHPTMERVLQAAVGMATFAAAATVALAAPSTAPAINVEQLLFLEV